MIVDGDGKNVPAIQMQMSPVSGRQLAAPALATRLRVSNPTRLTPGLAAPPASFHVRSAG